MESDLIIPAADRHWRRYAGIDGWRGRDVGFLKHDTTGHLLHHATSGHLIDECQSGDGQLCPNCPDRPKAKYVVVASGIQICDGGCYPNTGGLRKAFFNPNGSFALTQAGPCLWLSPSYGYWEHWRGDGISTCPFFWFRRDVYWALIRDTFNRWVLQGTADSSGFGYAGPGGGFTGVQTTSSCRTSFSCSNQLTAIDCANCLDPGFDPCCDNGKMCVYGGSATVTPG